MKMASLDLEKQEVATDSLGRLALTLYLAGLLSSTEISML